jgi:glutamine synthetase
MFNTFKEVEDYIKAEKIDLVDLLYCDLWGRMHHVTLSAPEFTPSVMSEGVGFDGSSVGFKHVQAGDMVLIPDLSTAFVDTFHNFPTLSFICNTYEADTKELYKFDPREIVRRVEKQLQAEGIADTSLWGPEFEFYIFDQITLKNTPDLTLCQIDSLEANWGDLENPNGYGLPEHHGYHASPPSDSYFQLRDEIVVTLEKIGIWAKYHHHEVGGPGQCEIETPMLGILKAGDAGMIIKYVTKMLAKKAGKTVTFLPKPVFGIAGSSIHYHQSLKKDGINLFYDPQGPSLMSKTGLNYIGGLLSHAPAVMAFTNPSTNSYRRLVPGYEAPIKAFFSAGNRSAAIRIPKYATQPDEVRMEFRPPDATANPYLAMAAMLLAGMDGIRRGIDPTAEGFGPINENIFNWTEEERSAIKSLPTSLEGAMQAMKVDNDFLKVGAIFDDTLLETWTKEKLREAAMVHLRPHPFEIETYYNC